MIIRFHHYWIYAYLMSIFFATSCVTYEKVNIQVLKKAQVSLNNEMSKIVLINNSVKRQSKSFSLDSICSKAYFSGLMQLAYNSPRFNKVFYPEITLINKSINNKSNIDWNRIESIILDSTANGAIVLRNFVINYTQPELYRYQDGSGYYSTLQVENEAHWIVYNASNKKIIDDIIIKDTLYWDANGIYDYEVYDQLPDLNSAIIQSCYYAGMKYAERIFQTWITENRYLMIVQNEVFMNGLNYFKSGDYIKAIDTWKKYADNKNKRLAAYACFNIAIACEMLDKIDIALEWAAKSYLHKPDNYTEYYISLLEERKKEKTEIEKQLE